MYVVRGADQGTEDDGITDVRAKDRRFWIAADLRAEVASRIVAASLERFLSEIDGAAGRAAKMRDWIVVGEKQHHLAEAALHIDRHRPVGADVRYRPALEISPGVRRVIRRAGRLRHERSVQSVRPRRQCVDVVVEVGSAELHVRIPAVTHKLGAHYLVRSMREAKRPVERDAVAADRSDACCLERSILVHSDAYDSPRLESRCVAGCDRRRARYDS